MLNRKLCRWGETSSAIEPLTAAPSHITSFFHIWYQRTLWTASCESNSSYSGESAQGFDTDDINFINLCTTTRPREQSIQGRTLAYPTPATTGTVFCDGLLQRMTPSVHFSNELSRNACTSGVLSIRQSWFGNAVRIDDSPWSSRGWWPGLSWSTKKLQNT